MLRTPPAGVILSAKKCGFIGLMGVRDQEGFVALLSKAAMDRNQTRLYGLLCALLVAVVVIYLPGLAGPFFSDDIGYILTNARITDTPLSQFWLLFTDASFKEYLPVRDLSYLLEYQLYGDSPYGYKVGNLLVYLLLLVVLWQATRSLIQLFRADITAPRAGYLALSVTILYAFYPVHVESVAWISGRKDLLSTLFALLALWQFCVMLARIEHPRREWLLPMLFATLSLVLALLSKAAVAPIAVVMGAIALAFFMRRAALRPAIIKGVAYSLPLLVTVLLMTWLHSRFGVQGGIGMTAAEMPPEILADYLGRVPQILGTLGQIALWPFELRLIYDVYPEGAARYLQLVIAGLVFVAGVYGGWRFIVHGSLIGLGLLAFLLLNLPYLQIMPFQTWSLASERFLILSGFGLLLSLVMALDHYTNRRILMVVIGMISAVFAYTSVQRASQWQDAEQLYLANYQIQPTLFYSASLKIQSIDIKRGDYAEALRAANAIEGSPFRPVMVNMVGFYRAIDQARQGGGTASLQQAAAALSQMHQALTKAKANLHSYADANYYLAAGFFLREAYLSFLQYDPNNAYLHYNLGLLTVNVAPRMAVMSARDNFVRAIELGGLDRLTAARAWNHLGLIYMGLQRYREAREAFIKADQLDPADIKAAYNLLLLDLLSGQSAVASSDYYRQRAQQRGQSAAAIASMLEKAHQR